MTMGERIKMYRERLGLTQDELAQKLGFKSRSSVNKLEKDIYKVSSDMLKRLSKALHVNEQLLLHDEEEFKKRVDPVMLELLDGDMDAFLNLAAHQGVPPEVLGRQNEPLPPEVVPIDFMPRHRVPIVGEVAAGEPIFAEEQHDVFVDGPEKADFALRVSGDSMKPNFLDGDVVYIKSTPEVPNGTVAVVFIDDSATLKHVYLNDSILTLISDNPLYSPIVINLKEHEYVRIIGVVVGFTRMFR